MVEIDSNPEFPDTYYELFLTSVDGVNAPILRVLPNNAKLVNGFYHHRRGTKFPAKELMHMSRNDKGSNPCRGIMCLEQDIQEATARMRIDILKEAQHMFDTYQEKLALFQLDPVTTDEKHLWTTAFAEKMREQVN